MLIAGVLAAVPCGAVQPQLPSLEVDSDGQLRDIPVEVLLDGTAPVVFEIVETSEDADAPGHHRYEGIPLERALQTLRISDDAHLELISTDGFLETLTPSQRHDDRVHGLIAYRDLEAEPPALWQTFQHGGQTLTPAPFYLVWQAVDPADAALTDDRPWPYALATVRVLAEPAAAAPPASAPRRVRAGYATFEENCLSCHAVRGRGGSMGPALAAPDAYVAGFDQAELARRIARITDYYPDSKMPVFASRLDAPSIDALIAYLAWMRTHPTGGE